MDNKIKKTVDEYIAQFPFETQKLLEQIRATIRKIVPEAEELIAYRMPCYKLYGKPLVYFAAFENHIGFYPLPETIKRFEPELSRYKQGKGSIQFPLDEPMPFSLIKKIVEYRVASIKKL